ncbi:circadian clock KaiB family protein [Marinobacter gelidimuriae]|uniref:circadian clock KaiB family protein n=1 Tax=Marinobacter gelidimuriae TaxID=2739064 RepID=UPI0003603491|nr:circadian clock KaiB family protein [Marinobacter gelidimuriae]
MSNNKYLLKLFITGYTPQADRAIKNINSICKNELAGGYHLEIINILENPQLAEGERIIATPTLIKVLPKPSRRVIGDLSNTKKVLLGLDLVAVNDSEGEELGHE